ncbi:MAG: hypothetical protein ACU0CO_03835 [Shimia sp.]
MTETLSMAAAAKARTARMTEETARDVVDAKRDLAIRRLATEVHRLNTAIIEAVEAGMTVEMVRASRHHCGEGRWGDMMVPVVRD